MSTIRFRKKPVEVEAVQWTGDNEDELHTFTGANFMAVEPEDRTDDPEATASVFDVLHSTWVLVYTGQWVIKGVKGEFYPIAQDVLTETYDRIDDLKLETKGQENETPHVGPVMMTPPIDEDYWLYRVKVSAAQAVVGFPKFGTVGIGFAVEENWNTNLPYTSDAEEIFDHIEQNRGEESITRDDCIAAIRMIQDAIKAAEEVGDDR